MRLPMKFGVSLQGTTALTKPPVAEGADTDQDIRIGRRPRHEFDQVQIARRGEEVSSNEAPAKMRAETLGQPGQRNAAGVGGCNGAGRKMGRHLLPEISLDLDVFNNRFDNPITIRQACQVIFEVAERDDGPGVLRVEGGRPLFPAASRPRLAAVLRSSWSGRTISSSRVGIPAFAR